MKDRSRGRKGGNQGKGGKGGTGGGIQAEGRFQLVPFSYSTRKGNGVEEKKRRRTRSRTRAVSKNIQIFGRISFFLLPTFVHHST